MEDFCKGTFWNQTLTWDPDNPDVTKCVQQTVLVWAPCIFLFLFAPLELHYIKTSRYSDIPWALLNRTKLGLTFLLLIISIVDFGMSIALIEEQNLPDSITVAAGLKILSFLLVLVFLFLHRMKGIRSSGLLTIFWFTMALLGVLQFRSEIIRYDESFSEDKNFDIVWDQYQFITYMIYYPVVVILFVLSCFSDPRPNVSTYKKYDNPSREMDASFFSKIFYQWFDAMTWTGFRRTLTENDMNDINPENATSELSPIFDKHWQDNVKKNAVNQETIVKDDEKGEKITKITTNGSILIPLIKSFGAPFWFAGFIKVILDLSQFLSPLLMNVIIDYIEADNVLWKGILYSLGLFGITFFQSLTQGQYFYKTYLVGFRIRSALISAIYRKSMRISSKAKRDTTVGEIVNLMSVDAQRFFELVSYLHILWSGPMVIIIAIVMLWQYIGVAVMAGLAVIVAMIPLSGVIASRLRQLQIGQMKIKDKRVKSMNEILNGMKVLKLYGWEPSFEDTILGVREGEMKILKKQAFYGAGTYFVWTMAPFLTTLASFITYVLMDPNNVLDPQTAFVSLALFNVLRFPTAMFPMMITMAAQAWVSVKRIDKFLNEEELDPDNVTNHSSDNALQIVKGTFTWGGEEKILKNINMRVKKKELAAVVGPVGCGKSSLVSALLGEMEKLEGSVNVDGKIAYVPQQAWIQNCTLEKNITFGRPYNKKLYDRVIDACALTADLAMLPGGDQTEIGEKGINLSGGQKQRVSIARAVYSDADIYLFDDPLSAVDAHVGKHIFDNILGENGLLKNKTRFLVTNAINFLPKVDEIFVIKDGFISESGSYRQLLSMKGAFSEFLTQFLQEVDDTEELREIEESLGENNLRTILERSVSTISGMNRSQGSPNGSLRRRDSKNSRKDSLKKEEPEKLDFSKSKANLMTKEESATGGVSWRVYLSYFKSIGLTMGITSVGFNVLSQVFSILSSFWLTQWSGDPEAGTDTSKRDLYMGVYGAYGVGQSLAVLGTSIILALACLRAARDLHNRLLHHSFRLPMSFFDTTPLGRVLNRFSKDVDTCDNVLPSTVRFWLIMFFNVLGVFIVISIGIPIFMSVIIPLLILYYLIQRFYISTSRQLKRIESVTRSPIYSHFGESINGQSTIRAYGDQKRFILDNELKVDFNQTCSYPSIIANRWLGVRLEILGAFVVFFTSLFAILMRESLSPALAGLTISYALQISTTLSMLVRMTSEVETNIVSVERIDEYAELPEEAPWKTVEVDPKWPQNGVVEFKDFQVRYREGLDLVLKGITFKVNSLEKVGIVGRTGAGKSSLTLALFRIIEPAGGKIIIDDIDVTKIGLHSLRSRLTIIPQDPVLFSDTLRMNLDPFKIYSDEAIWTALEQSHLKDFVRTLPLALSHHITEGGENLSVGQRQLVCLARALLRKTKVLILDEATASIDLETDELIQKTIRSEFSDCTILTIAHRLNTILDSDRVLVLDKGAIAEFDTPSALLADQNSIFYGMAKKAGLVNGEIDNDNENNDSDEKPLLNKKDDVDTKL